MRHVLLGPAAWACFAAAASASTLHHRRHNSASYPSDTRGLSRWAVQPPVGPAPRNDARRVAHYAKKLERVRPAPCAVCWRPQDEHAAALDAGLMDPSPHQSMGLPCGHHVHGDCASQRLYYINEDPLECDHCYQTFNDDQTLVFYADRDTWVMYSALARPDLTRDHVAVRRLARAVAALIGLTTAGPSRLDAKPREASLLMRYCHYTPSLHVDPVLVCGAPHQHHVVATQDVIEAAAARLTEPARARAMQSVGFRVVGCAAQPITSHVPQLPAAWGMAQISWQGRDFKGQAVHVVLPVQCVAREGWPEQPLDLRGSWSFAAAPSPPPPAALESAPLARSYRLAQYCVVS